MDRARDPRRQEAAPPPSAAPPQGEPAWGLGTAPLVPEQVLRLQQGVGNQAVSRLMVARHTVAGTPIHRHEQLDLFGDGTPANLGMTLEEFVDSTRAQADWFTEPTLTDADRTDLWRLLLRTTEGPHILAGLGDVRLAELRTVPEGDWVPLRAFCRACHPDGNTVRILSPAGHSLLSRRETGRTLIDLEAIIPARVLRLTVSEQQLVVLSALGNLADLAAYWTTFDPHLERSYEPGPGARGPEFENVINLLIGPGIAPFMALQGRIRNLHRFSEAMLARLVHNFADTSRSLPVHLVLHTSHDSSAFQDSANLFEDLVLNSPNLVLMLEGQDHITDITALIPTIAATYGQPDATGTPRIAQAMIAGHGQAQRVELAGTGAPVAGDTTVAYPSESLDIGDPASLQRTQDLLDTLLRNLDPATARVVFAGCLVGSNPVPEGTAPADMGTHIATHPSLATFTEQRGAAAGLAPGFTQAARASVGLEASSSLMDASGNLALQYTYDPTAFGTALTYAATGREPEGLLRAAVEVAATAGPVVAANQLRTRLAAGGTGWYDEVTLLFVRIAMDGVAVGAAVDMTKLNTLTHMSGYVFLAGWIDKGVTVDYLNTVVNGHPALAPDVYAGLAATPTFTAASSADDRVMRLKVEQAWIALPAAREANLLAFLEATPTLTAEVIGNHLDTALLAPASPTLFPAAAAATPGRIRLALAWLKRAPANADMRAFLNDEVVTPGATPELTPAVRAELGGVPESEVLESLGRLLATTPVVPVGGGPAVQVPNANAEIMGRGVNQVLVEPNPYEATVLPDALNVRPAPHMNNEPFAWLHKDDVVRVMGFTHNWAAIDQDGELGFVHRSKITPP